MASFFRLNKLNNVVLSSVLITFPLAVLTPPPVYGQINVGFNDINFGIMIQKLVDRGWKYYNKKDGDSLIDVALDIKHEVEAYRGIKVNLEKKLIRLKAILEKKVIKFLKTYSRNTKVY